MRATVMYGAGDVRIENVPDAAIIEPTDALVCVTRACICGSDLWPYRTLEPSGTGRRMGHEAIGIVEAVGAEVRTLKVGLLRRYLCLLPRRAAHLVHPRRLLRHR
jgi:threonine dehydrogenase-like Zn-dependent dehydrogenase